MQTQGKRSVRGEDFINTSSFVLDIAEVVKKTFDIRNYNKVGFESSKHGFLSWNGLKISAIKEGLTGTPIAADGKDAGKMGISIPDVETFEKVVARLQANREKRQTETEKRQDEEANSPRTLAEQATESMTAARKSLDFHIQMNERNEKRPGPKLDLTPFEAEFGELRVTLSRARRDQNGESLKAVIETLTGFGTRLETAVTDNLIESIDSRLAYHQEDLPKPIFDDFVADLGTITKQYEESGDASATRKALVELNKRIGAEVKISLGGVYAPLQGRNDRSDGRRTYTAPPARATIGEISLAKQAAGQPAPSRRDSRQ